MSKKLWEPTEAQITSSNMYRFLKFTNERYQANAESYDDLYQWSIAHIPNFWAAMWDFGEIVASQPYEEVVDDHTKMPGAKWFSGTRLNFAANLLRFRDEREALVFNGEGQIRYAVTYAQLYDEVARLAEALRELGVSAGDRVVGFIPNMPQAVFAMLAATSIGAMWSSCSPDFGDTVERVDLLALEIVSVGREKHFGLDLPESVKYAFDAEILKQLPSIEKVVVVPYIESTPDITNLPNGAHYADFRSDESELEIYFEQLPFDHPLYIMYSSGTTGLPKCMVQSAGGILIHHIKELMLHTNLTRDDTIFYFTTCGWMMWNWLVSSLAVGARVMLYDGNPFHPDPGALWQMAQDEGITVFGTSAGYIAALQNADAHPGRDYDLSALRAVLSTGSPLSIEGFEFIYTEVKKELQLASIAGGSDLNGCFAPGNPMLPVYAGELQCRGLAMNVQAFDGTGRSLENQQGELVCTAPFPSMPIYFWDDADGKKYHKAYFDVYEGVWRHGDYIEITDRGTVVIYGRSDATLNPGGVRIGTAEIYRQVEQLSAIEDSLVIGQNWKNDVRVILFVKMAPGIDLSDEIISTIKTTIRTNASPRHVPQKIIEVPAIPYTLNMKKVELAVKKIIEGQPVLNKDALSNPEALDFYANLDELQTD